MGAKAQTAGNTGIAPHPRPIILVFIKHYLPGFKAGGPIRTIENMVSQLGDEFDFRLVTSDRDIGDDQPYPGIPTNRWISRHGVDLFYLSPGLSGWRTLLRSLKGVQIGLIYLNGFFSVGGSILPLILRHLGQLPDAPMVLAPRGEFSEGALAIKAFKKQAFVTASRLLRLHDGAVFQASSAFEQADIERRGLTNRVVIAVDPPPRRSVGRPMTPAGRGVRDRSRDGAFRLVFLSRISPKKNLTGALEILAGIEGLRVDFDVYGILEEPDYWARCQTVIAALPGNVRVRYRGPVRPDEVETTLSTYDAFLFPTLGENYGHVIREALSAGLPVLISDQTPWRGLEAVGAGADLPLGDLDAFAARIRDWAALPVERFQSMREAARRLGDDPETAEEALQANRRMFLDALRHDR